MMGPQVFTLDLQPKYLLAEPKPDKEELNTTLKRGQRKASESQGKLINLKSPNLFLLRFY